MSTRIVRIELGMRSLAFAMLGIALLWLFEKLWPVLLTVVVALMLVGMLTPFVHHLEQRKFRRSHSIAVVFCGLLALLTLFAALTVPRFVAQLDDILTQLPSMKTELAAHLDQYRYGHSLAESLREMRVTQLISDAQSLGLRYSSKIIEVVAYALTALFLALYMIIDRDRLRGSAFALIPRNYHVRASRIMLRLETIVGGYLRGQLITSAMMMCFTFIVLVIAGVKNPVALALFAGIVDVLPYVGALLACIPLFLATLPQGTTTALIVLAVLATYQELESRVIVPRLYGEVLKLPAAVVVIALLVGMKLLGVLGALLALPIAAGIIMIMEELRFAFPGEDRDRRQLENDREIERRFQARAAGEPAEKAALIASEIAAELHVESVLECARQTASRERDTQ